MQNDSHNFGHFGEHLTIDGYFGNYEKLNDRNLVYKCLDELPTILGMQKLITPIVKLAEEPIYEEHKDPGGWSGYVLIAESHISIHTFPKRGFISADVYTCRNDMDSDFVIQYLTDAFTLKEVETNFLKRGVKYPVKNIY